MLCLALDTAGPVCAVAIARSGAGDPTILARAEERIGRGHAERLMPMIEAALSEARVGFEDLDRVAATTGPGSFTGVRIGVAAARGLALALGIEAVGVGSLSALALPVMRSRHAGTLAAVLDAKRKEVYVEARELASRKVIIHAVATPVGNLVARLADAPRPLILVGAGAPLLAAAFGEPHPEIAGLADAPDISDVALLALAGKPGVAPTPLYARGADARPQGDKAVARL